MNRAYDAANASDVAPAQLVGCVTPTNGYSRSQACAGGFTMDAFDYAKRGTLVLNTLYPYAQSPKDDPNMAKCMTYYIDVSRKLIRAGCLIGRGRWLTE